jgi:hypothetical protein
MGGRETLLMMTKRNSDVLLGQGVHFKAAVAFYPICWRYNHVPGADFGDLVDAPSEYSSAATMITTVAKLLARRCCANSRRQTRCTCRYVLSRVRPMSSTRSTVIANFTIRPETGVKAERFTSDPIRKRVNKHAMTSHNSLLLH